MKIPFGPYVPLNNYEDEPDIPLNDDEGFPTKRICVCGHTLLMHGFTMVRRGIKVSICVVCGSEKCKKFEWSGELEDDINPPNSNR